MLAIKNATIVTNDEQDSVIYDGAIIVNKDRIESVGKTKDLDAQIKKAETVIDGKNKILIPGLVNVHTHVIGQVFKGFTEDGASEDFYKGCFPMESYLNEESSYWLALSGCLETLKFGSVFINDLFHYADQTAQVIEKIGMRAVLEHKVYDVKSLSNLQNMDYSRNYEDGIRRLEENENLIKKWHGAADGRIHCWVGSHAPDTNSPELLKAGRKLADEYGVGIHIHVAQTAKENDFIRQEYDMTSVGFLDSLGFLSDDVICAHLAFATSEDIKILEERGSKFAHCPVMMAKFGTFPRIAELLNSKIPMGIGTDWVTLNPWQDMRAAIEVTRSVTGEVPLQSAHKAFRMMTTDAAKMFGMEDDLGSLEVGKKADILVIDKNRPNLVPMKEIIPSLVYNMTGNEIEQVYIDGKLVVDNGSVVGVNEIEVMNKVQAFSEEIWVKGGYFDKAHSLI